MSLTIYQATNEHLCKSGEQLERLLWSEAAPLLGGMVSMESDRLWQIVHIETYQVDDSLIHLAFTSPLGTYTPREYWDITRIRQDYPALSFYLLLNGIKFETWGWRMDGMPPSGLLHDYEPIPNTTLMKPIETGLFVESAQAHHAVGDSSYTAIHLCRCREAVVAA